MISLLLLLLSSTSATGVRGGVEVDSRVVSRLDKDSSYTLGTKSVLVIPLFDVDWNFDDLSSFMNASSKGKLSLEFTTTPTVSVSGCDHTLLGYYRGMEAFDTLAFAAAAEAGYDHADYDFNIVITNCSIGTLAVGWIGYPGIVTTDFSTLPHEFGHNFGADHASASSQKAYWTDLEEYGNPFSVMGSGDEFLVEGKMTFDWIDDLEEIIEPNGTWPLPAMIATSTENRYLFIEHRDDLGGAILTWSDLLPTRGTTGIYGRTVLVDATPLTNSLLDAYFEPSCDSLLLDFGTEQSPDLKNLQYNGSHIFLDIQRPDCAQQPAPTHQPTTLSVETTHSPSTTQFDDDYVDDYYYYDDDFYYDENEDDRTVLPTSNPTSPMPTTSEPTTVAPSTLGPTTLAPTSAVPTSLAPTTSEPTTYSPTTMKPTTVMPTTLAPTTEKPTTLAPAVATTIPSTLHPIRAPSYSPSKSPSIPLASHHPTSLRPSAAPSPRPTTHSPSSIVPDARETASPTTLVPTTEASAIQDPGATPTPSISGETVVPTSQSFERSPTTNDASTVPTTPANVSPTAKEEGNPPTTTLPALPTIVPTPTLTSIPSSSAVGSSPTSADVTMIVSSGFVMSGITASRVGETEKSIIKEALVAVLDIVSDPDQIDNVEATDRSLKTDHRALLEGDDEVDVSFDVIVATSRSNQASNLTQLVQQDLSSAVAAGSNSSLQAALSTAAAASSIDTNLTRVAVVEEASLTKIAEGTSVLVGVATPTPSPTASTSSSKSKSGGGSFMKTFFTSILFYAVLAGLGLFICVLAYLRSNSHQIQVKTSHFRVPTSPSAKKSPGVANNPLRNMFTGRSHNYGEIPSGRTIPNEEYPEYQKTLDDDINNTDSDDNRTL